MSITMKYAKNKANDNNFNNINEHYAKCKKFHRPYIVIKTRRKYANIEFDHISMPKGYDKLLAASNDKIHVFADTLLRKYGITKSSYQTNSFIIRFMEIPIDNADPLADELYNFINKIVN